MEILLPWFKRCYTEGPPPVMDGSLPLMIGYSVRNRAFKREFFQSALALAEKHFSALFILIVDLPYAWNDAAKRGASCPSDAEFARAELEGDERFRMVRSALAGVSSTAKVTISRWREYSSLIEVNVLRDELREASRCHENVYSTLSQYSSLWSREVALGESGLFHGFLIEEFPVFTYLYYKLGFLVDIYPGPNFSYFRLLESGAFRAEIPIASAIASSRRLTFLNVGYRDASV